MPEVMGTRCHNMALAVRQFALLPVNAPDSVWLDRGRGLEPAGICDSRSGKNFGLAKSPGWDSVPTIFSKATGAGVNSKPKRVG